MIKICFDSSAVGKLIDSPDRDRKNTVAMSLLMKKIETARKQYELVVSPVFMIELYSAPEYVTLETDEFLTRFNFTQIDFTLESKAADLADLYVKQSVLPAAHYANLMHISYASVSHCDFLVSCDNHFLKPKTAILVKKINSEQNVFVPQIISPSALLEQWQKK